jgi:hypothetical protein
MVLPLSIFVYALLENPRPSKVYWTFVTTYVIVTISMKYFVQLPVFCSTPAWGVKECSDLDVPAEILIKRYDFIIGLQKFNGPASFPQD